MTPRWKIRRQTIGGSTHRKTRQVWAIYLDGEWVESFVKWENALTYVEIYERA